MNMYDQKYALFRIRFLAALIDGVILAVFGGALMHILPFVGGLLLFFIYAPILESSSARATIGKRVMGIQVTTLSGSQLSFTDALIRNIIKVISSAMLCIGHLVALFTEKKQAVHDLVVDSVVVPGQESTPLFDAWLENFKGILGKTNIQVVNKESDRFYKIEKLQALREKGALSEEEFQAEKRKILEQG